MLSNLRGLVFPKLRFIETVYLKDDEKKEIDLYSLDWEAFDETLTEHVKYWWDKHGMGREGDPFPGLERQLPYEFMFIRDYIYAIPVHYLKEIKRVSSMALLEWNIPRGFDTMIRGECLYPAEAYVKTAFMLLGDCVYDPETKYYDHSNSRKIRKTLLTYLFWVHQVGRGMPMHLSGLQEFSNYHEESYNRKIYDKFITFEKSIPNRFGIADLTNEECNGIKMSEKTAGLDECVTGQVQPEDPE